MRGRVNRFPAIKSDVPGIEWPPISRGRPAVLAAMLRQLEDTQWMSREALEAMQFQQLGVLAAHCEKYSPQLRGRLRDAGLKPDDLTSPEGLRRLPVLRRRELQKAADLFCSETPIGHAPVYETRTSGSTGEPVVVRRTLISNLDWLAVSLRQNLWEEQDFLKPYCAIRATLSAPARREDWGWPASLLFDTGPSLGIPITTDIDRQIDLIVDFGADTLLVYPSNLAAIVRKCTAGGIALPSLRHIYTTGETLDPQLRDQARAAFDASLCDCYSSEEIGCMAIDCPDSALYHVMAETVIVEILGPDGEPCRDGEIGRVTVTDLRNFATPIIRYDIGDYAEPGPPCACGRGLPTIRRIHGRERNLILMPDGTTHWPLLGRDRYREMAPILQFQLVQDGRESIEVRLVVDRPLKAGEVRDLSAHIQASLGFPFAVRFTYFDRAIPPGPTGKFEEFVSRI